MTTARLLVRPPLETDRSRFTELVRDEDFMVFYPGMLTQEQVSDHFDHMRAVCPKADPGLTDDDLVFEQATDLLWEPHLSPQLRSALYKVLADTPGVTVQTGAKDSSGRPATEISRYQAAGKTTVETFEDPATGATLESAWRSPGSLGEDLYLSTTYTNTIPADPYQS